MLKKLSSLLAVAIPFITVIASAEKPVPVNLGHNQTSTSDVFAKGQCTVGLLTVGCGLSDKTTVVTSPWLLVDYNMYNIFVRHQFKKKKRRTESLQLAYFKTFEGEREMEAIWLDWIRGHRITKKFKFYLDVQAAYYFNEIRPFSLRRPRIWKSAAELSVNTLYELKVTKLFYMQAEFGVLGLVRKYPLIHTGGSFQWRGKNWLAQLGFSMTGTLQAIFEPARRFDMSVIFSNGEDHRVQGFDDFIKYDFSIHPEFALQYFF